MRVNVCLPPSSGIIDLTLAIDSTVAYKHAFATVDCTIPHVNSIAANQHCCAKYYGW